MRFIHHLGVGLKGGDAGVPREGGPGESFKL